MTTHSLPYILGNFPGTEYVYQITGGKVALVQSVKPLLPPQLALKAAIGTSMFERGQGGYCWSTQGRESNAWVEGGGEVTENDE